MAALKPRIPPQLPLAFIHTPSDLLSTTNKTIQDSNTLLHDILLKPASSATFQNSILPIAHNENHNTSIALIASLYKYIAPSQELRDGSIAASKLWKDYYQDVSCNRELYDVVHAVHEKNEPLDQDHRHYLEELHSGLLRSGAGIPPGEKRDRLEWVGKRISELCLLCCKNTREEKGGLWFSAEELKGLPTDALMRFAREAEKAEENRDWVSFKQADLTTCMEYAVKDETRKRLWLGNRDKCAANTVLIKELIVLRAERALLLGFESHAEYVFTDSSHSLLLHRQCIM